MKGRRQEGSHSWIKSVVLISFNLYGFIKIGGRKPQAMLRWMSVRGQKNCFPLSRPPSEWITPA